MESVLPGLELLKWISSSVAALSICVNFFQYRQNADLMKRLFEFYAEARQEAASNSEARTSATAAIRAVEKSIDENRQENSRNFLQIIADIGRLLDRAGGK